MQGRQGFPAARLGVVTVTALVVSVLGAAPAHAGEWMRALCQNPDGSAAPIDGLVFSGQNVGAYGGASGGSSCPGGLSGLGGLVGSPTGVWASVSADANAATEATWTYSAPAGSSIAGGSVTGVDITQTTYGASLSDMDAWISSPGDDASQADLVADCATPAGSGNGSLPGSSRCSENPSVQAVPARSPGLSLQSLTPIGSGSGSPLVANIDHAGGTHLYMTAACSTADTDSCMYSGGPLVLSFIADFGWADVLLSDDTQPSATSFGGSLLAAGSAHGTAHLTFTAQDLAGPGVYTVIVRVDGRAVYQGTPNTNGGECAPVGTDSTTGAWIFDNQQPCPTSVDLDVPVDTTQLADGQHNVQVVVQDAAQNTSTVLDQTITTANLTTAAAAGRETPGATTPAPTPAPTPTTYTLKLDGATEALVSSVLRRRYDQSGLRLSGTVIDESGTPTPNVGVSVGSALLSGTAYTTVAQATSDAAGHFDVQIPRGDSRQLHLSAGTGAVAIEEIVTPNLSLRVRSLRGARLLFTGTVAIDPGGGPPPVVEIQDRTPNGWQPVATVTAGKKGDYRILYPSSRLTIGYSFSLRAITSATALWQAAASPVTRAKVRG